VHARGQTGLLRQMAQAAGACGNMRPINGPLETRICDVTSGALSGQDS
jgi:hypothetical protein